MLSVTELSPIEFVGRLDQMITVYAAAMRPSAEMLPGRRSIMAGHAAHPGFRALLATEDGSGAPAGFGYGFHGAAGQWWHDTVARAVFRAVDKYGNLRRYPAGEVTLTLTGPATLIGDNPFAFGAYGGLGAVWIRSLPGQTGTITLAASQPELGQAQAQVRSVPATRDSQLA